MDKIYFQLREEARNIVASLPAPQFYQLFEKEVKYSRQMLNSHPLLIRIKQDINSVVENDFGHGMHHSDLVCVDAGAIIQVEMRESRRYDDIIKGNDRLTLKSTSSKQEDKINDKLTLKSTSSKQEDKIKEKNYNASTNLPADIINNHILLVQAAGLLHDIKRKEKQHSAKGAAFARTFLSTGGYPFKAGEIDIICSAIKEHEAFQSITVNQASLISNALYDADKFRWGPDNFTDTLWDMVMFSNSPISEFIKRYPAGMAALEQIKTTFRTDIGKKYGPNFIDIGIETGSRLFKTILTSINT